MAAWRKVPPENEARLDMLMAELAGAERRKMFGCPCYFIDGNMLVGAHQEDYILRLSPEDREEILERPDVTHFMPMGRPMREYVLIPPAIHQDDAVFQQWIARGATFVRTLPPPEKKAKKR